MDETAPQTCDGNQTYGSSTIASANDLPNQQKVFVICVRLSDAAGNIVYGKSQAIERDTVLPVFASLAKTAEGADGYVNLNEKFATNPIWILSSSGQTTTQYTVTLDDSTPVTCDSSQTYSPSAIPRAIDLPSDKPWIICVELKDQAGNVVYGKSDVITRDTVAPVFTSLNAANEASDGSINNNEKNSAQAAWALVASGQTTTAYTTILDSTLSPVCDISQTYGSSSIPTIASISTDATWLLCVKLSDAAGNITYGPSQAILRDIMPPVFTSLVGNAEASDGYINNSEKNSNNAAWTFSGSGYDTLNYTMLLDNTSPVTCDNSQFYGMNSITQIFVMAIDKPWVICAKLTDPAGNIVYGKSAVITRDTSAPSITSFNRINEGSNGYVNIGEMNATNPLWSLVASGQTSTSYTSPLDNTVSVTCDAFKTYDQSGLKRASDLGADLPYVTCVKLSDDAGNITYGKSPVVTRDTDAPLLTSLALANEATDGYLNSTEIPFGNPVWELTASGQSSTMYTVALDDTIPVACDQTKTYSSASLPTFTLASTQKRYSVCVELKDSAGNTTYGKGGSVYIDYTLPTAGASGAVYTANKSSNSLRVTWTAASDNKTSASDIKYQVYYSTSSSFDSISQVKAGTTANTYTANITQLDISGLDHDTVYYFNVLAQDEAGNERVYTKISDETNEDGFIQVSVGDTACGLSAEGKIYCWGTNNHGKLANGTLLSYYTPRPITSTDRFKKVTMGIYHACALRVDNRILCWGSNSSGQLGNNDTANQYLPVLVSGTDTYLDVSVGASSTCAIRTDGLAFCWGSNFANALGNGPGSDMSVPTQVNALTDLKSISSGYLGSCALKINGDAYCWGANITGEIGDGTTNIAPTPVLVSGGLKFKQLLRSKSGFFTCGLTTIGAAYCWGDDTSNQLGDDAVVANKTMPVPVQGGFTFREIGVGSASACGIVDNGDTRCWGAGMTGVLGNSTTSVATTPSLVSLGYKWRTIASEFSFGNCGISDHGKTFCWGDRFVAGEGMNDYDEPVATDTTNLTGDSEYTKISGGWVFSCGLKSNGKVYCWGNDGPGYLGDGAGDSSNANHILVPLPERAIDLNVGYYVTCATTSSGNLYCWGSGEYGNLGTGNQTDQPSPVQVGSGTKWLTSTGGNGYHCALTSQGKPYCWGANDRGQLGRGNAVTPELNPIPVSVGSDVYVSIAAGAWHTCGVTDAGIAKCWGFNSTGQIGDGTRECPEFCVTSSH